VEYAKRAAFKMEEIYGEMKFEELRF